MRSYFQKLLPLCVLLCLVLTACGDLLPSFIGGGEPLTITIVYGSEKQAWLEPLVEAYNAEKHETAEGQRITVDRKSVV